MEPRIRLKSGRERSVLRRHPWIFAGAIERIEPDEIPGGATVTVLDSNGQQLGVGAWSPQSQIAVRMWSFEAVTIDAAWWRGRVEAACARRGGPRGGEARRLIHAEADGLPGVTVDRYASWLVCQLTSAGAEAWRDTLVEALRAVPDLRGIYERSDASVRTKEGLEPRTGVLWGDDPPPRIEIDEDGLRFEVDVRCGHKTGFYLDQRSNRARVAALADGARMLDAFCYSGGFGAAALRAGAAEVIQIDESGPALEQARRHAENNGGTGRLRQIEGNVFHELRSMRDRREQFDLIVLDPPKFAESRAQLDRACRGYKDINLLGLKLLRPGGTLATFSCSGHVDGDLFEKILAGAALDARRDVRIVARLEQADDHPVLLSFPESRYLKGRICRVD